MIVEYRKLKITTHFVLITIWSVLYIGWTGAMGPNDKCVYLLVIEIFTNILERYRLLFVLHRYLK